MTQEALKLALEALELVNIEFVCNGAHHAKKDRHSLDEDCPVTMRYRTAITAIKEALAQEQEPVEWPRTMERGALIQWLHLEMAQHNLDVGTIEQLLKDAEALLQPQSETCARVCGVCGYRGITTDHVGQCPRCHWDALMKSKEKNT